jgi:putative pyruvate formate lyase activating enzyme
MIRQNARVRIDDDGLLEIVDPGFDSLGLLQAIDPDFQIHRKRLRGFVSPRLLRLKTGGCDLDVEDLNRETDDDLWARHRSCVDVISKNGICHVPKVGEASLIDLKVELARRILSNCSLCAHNCGVDRLKGELGICRLGTEVTVAEHFVHIAEEAAINPSLVLNLAGCGLRCRFCQQFALLEPRKVVGESLDDDLWSKLDLEGARSMSFVGGNPDESLFAILRFLRSAPSDWKLPIVWNCHAYATLETIGLLEGVVDAFVPDFKYENEDCGRRLSAISNYPKTAKAGIAAMVAQDVPVIVRILVLPGHFDCCHAQALDFLASLRNRRRVFVSVRGQYSPDWKITTRDGSLARRVTSYELEAVNDRANALGLQLIY